MLIHKSINFLRRTALLLFVVPLVGLIGSLIVHNYLVSYKYLYEDIIPFKKIVPGATYEQLCSKENFQEYGHLFISSTRCLLHE